MHPDDYLMLYISQSEYLQEKEGRKSQEPRKYDICRIVHKKHGHGSAYNMV